MFCEASAFDIDLSKRQTFAQKKHRAWKQVDLRVTLEVTEHIRTSFLILKQDLLRAKRTGP